MAIPSITPTGGSSVPPVVPASGGGTTAGYGAGAEAGFGPAALISLSPEAQAALGRLTGADIAATQNARSLETLLKALPDRALSDAAKGSGRAQAGGDSSPAAASDSPRAPAPSAEQVRHLVQFLVEQDRRLNAAPRTPGQQPTTPQSRAAQEEAAEARPQLTGNFQVHVQNQGGLTILQNGKDVTAAVLSGALAAETQAVALSGWPGAPARRAAARRPGLPTPEIGRKWRTLLILGGIVLAVLITLALR